MHYFSLPVCNWIFVLLHIGMNILFVDNGYNFLNFRISSALSLSSLKVSQLDRVPLLLRSADTVNTIPDERVTATFLAHLCARLLDLSVEIKAARVLQVAWRRQLAQRRLKELRVKYG